MKIKYIVVLIIIGMFSTLNAVDIEGFRTLNWNDPSSKLANKVQDKTTAHNIKIKNLGYTVKKDKLSIGNGKVDSITYYFFDDRYYYTFIEYHGWSNFQILKQVLEAKYGKANQDNPYIQDYDWSIGDSIVSIEYSDITHEGSIMFMNFSISNEAKSYAEKVANEGIKDL